jgi:Amt family ammonium transporter
VGALFIIGWNIVWTSLIMCFIKYVCRVPLRMSEEQLLAGDNSIHGESAYVLGPYVTHEQLTSSYSRRDNPAPGELGLGGVTIGHDPQVAEKSSGSDEIKQD